MPSRPRLCVSLSPIVSQYHSLSYCVIVSVVKNPDGSDPTRPIFNTLTVSLSPIILPFLSPSAGECGPWRQPGILQADQAHSIIYLK
jgi:hypothetical protein